MTSPRRPMKRSDLNDSDPYTPAWIRYANAQRSTLLSVGLFLGGGGLSALLVTALGTSAPGWLWPVAMLPWIIAAIAKSQAAVRAPCPRCDKPFHSTSWGHNAFARRCLHCGLPKWAPEDPRGPAVQDVAAQRPPEGESGAPRRPSLAAARARLAELMDRE